MQEKENTIGASPEKLTPSADKTIHREGHVEETKFSQVKIQSLQRYQKS
jgi:hypothetical protein